MKPWDIVHASVQPLTADLIQPFRTALGEHTQLKNLLFSVTLSDSTTGFGEAAVATHITGESYEDTAQNLRSVAEWLKGRDIRDYLNFSYALQERFSQNPSMIAAVETALLDGLTQTLNVPLWRFFGTRCHLLKTDITVVIADLKETEHSVKRFYRAGFRAFKVKIGRDIDLDIKRIAAVKRLARGGKIYLDANQGFSTDEILKIVKELKRMKIRIDLLEQPVPRADREGLKKVSRLSGVPVCADESVRSMAEAIAVIREKAAPVINIKPTKFGIIRSREIAQLAQAAGIKLMIGGMLESSLSMTASAHLAAGLGCFDFIDLDTPFFIKGDVARNRYLSSTGIYDLRRVRSGIGIKP